MRKVTTEDETVILPPRLPTTYGKTCFPGGRTVELHSRHQEWTTYAANLLSASEDLIRVLENLTAYDHRLLTDMQLTSLREEARRAIAKARGEQ